MSGERIYLWEAGSASGTARDAETAMEMALPYLQAGAGGLVQEARVEMLAAGKAGLVSSHRRTGRAWRGRMLAAGPCWERAAAEGTAAGMG